MSFIYFIVLIGFLVFIHELGHFLSAKYFNVYVGEFAIGMGPKLFKKKIGETEYTIRALPIGGFVQMAGEENTDFDVPYERTIKGIKTWQKIVIMGAGIVMNLLVAYTIFTGIFMYQGSVPVYTQPEIVEIVEGSGASESGLLVGDVVTAVQFENSDKILIDDSRDFMTQLQMHLTPSKPDVTLFVDRDGSTEEILITSQLNSETDSMSIGIQANSVEYQPITFLESFKYGAIELVDQTKLIFDTLANVIRGIGVDKLSGPVGIFQMSAQTASLGLGYFINLMAILSLNLAILNALPLPALDGGRILITIFEKITGRTLSEKVELVIMSASMILLLGLMVYVTFNDIGRLLG